MKPNEIGKKLKRIEGPPSRCRQIEEVSLNKKPDLEELKVAAEQANNPQSNNSLNNEQSGCALHKASSIVNEFCGKQKAQTDPGLLKAQEAKESAQQLESVEFYQ